MAPWLLALLLALAPVAAEAAYMLPGQPIRPKDFTLVKKDGYYHVFYIVHSTALANDVNEVEFGHAISPDLYHWTQLPPVLQVDPQGWDNLHVWAPSIVQKDGLYWMFYTGVSRSPGHYNDTQRIGLAVSSDLNTWTRVGGGPIYAGTRVPWAWSDSTSSVPAFRDPFVMPDPNNPGSWLMYYTASYGIDTAATVVGVARSNGDFTQWTDAGPLEITWRNNTFNSLTESPHLFQHNGLWYLFITTNSGQPLTFYTSPNPTGSLAEWTYRGRLRNMLGFDTSSWYASECISDGRYDFFAYVAGDRVELRQVQYGSSWTFALLQPPFFRVVSMDWVPPSVREDSTAALQMVTANYYAGPPVLQPYLVDSLGAEAPVPAESLAFDPSPALSADSSTVTWLARRVPRLPWTDSLHVTRLRVRTTDSTAASGVLTVRAPAPPQLVVQALAWLQPTVLEGHPADFSIRTANWWAGAMGLRAFVLDSLGAETEVPPESLGLERHPVLSADSSAVTWVARRWPAVPDTDRSTVTRVLLRSPDGTVSSNVLEVQPPDLQLQSLAWADPVVPERTAARLVVRSRFARAGLPSFRTWLVDGTGHETEVAPESLGFTRQPALDADSAIVTWLARRVPAPNDTDTVTVTRLVVRTADSLLTSGVLTVRANPVVGVRALGWVEPAVKSGDPARLVLRTRFWFAGSPTLRTWYVRTLVNPGGLESQVETEVAPESLGFDAHPVPASDSVVVTWAARRWPVDDDTDRTSVTHLVVRADGSPAAPAELYVSAGDLRVTSLAWSPPSARDGDSVRFVIRALHPRAGVPAFRTWLADGAGHETEVAPESLGLPAEPTLDADSVAIPWRTRRVPAAADTDTVAVTRLVVRTADSLVAAAPLVVRSPEPRLFVRALGWAEPGVPAGHDAHLLIRTRNWFAGPPRLRTWTVDGQGAETEVAPESLGIAATPALASDSTLLTWTARRWPPVPDSDRATTTRVIVRDADSAAASGVLVVSPPGVDLVSLAWAPDAPRAGDPASLVIRSRHPLAGPPVLRAWTVDGLGAETEVVPESVGVASHPVLAADSVALAFTARRYPAVSDTDTVTVTRVIVRDAGGAIATGVMTVRPPVAALAVRALGWTATGARSGDAAQLVIRTRNWFAGPIVLRTWLADGFGGETEVAPESLGIDAHPVANSDSTVVTWTARRWPLDDDADRATLTRVIVRSADGAVSAPVFVVRAADLLVTSLAWSPAALRSGEAASLVIRSRHPRAGPPALRAWTVSALGAETEVVPESLGVASHPALAADSVVFGFTARRWPAVSDTDSVTVTRVVLRTADLAVSTGILVVNPPLPVIAVRSLAWTESAVRSGDAAHLTIRTRNWFAGPPQLRAWTVSALGAETEVVPESLGIASHPVMTSDFRFLSCTVRRWPPVSDADRTTVTRIVVRDAAGVVASGVLLVQPPVLQVTAVDWLQSQVREADTASFVIRSVHPLAGPPVLMAWTIDAGGGATPVPPESLGIASQPALASDSVVVRWVAKRWPRVPANDTTTTTRIVIGLADETVASGELLVRAPAQPLVAGADDDAAWRPPSLRVLSGRAGGAIALSLHLPAPAFARVELFDVLGRRVRELAAGTLPRGDTVLPLRGGGALENGLYFARVRAGGRPLVARVLVLDH